MEDEYKDTRYTFSIGSIDLISIYAFTESILERDRLNEIGLSEKVRIVIANQQKLKPSTLQIFINGLEDILLQIESNIFYPVKIVFEEITELQLDVDEEFYYTAVQQWAKKHFEFH